MRSAIWHPSVWVLKSFPSLKESAIVGVLVCLAVGIGWQVLVGWDFSCTFRQHIFSCVLDHAPSATVQRRLALYGSPLKIGKVICDWMLYENLPEHILASMWRVYPGIILGTLIGFPLGITLALFPRFAFAVFVIGGLLYAISDIGMYYAFLRWFGLFEEPKIAVSFWVAFITQWMFAFLRCVGILNPRIPVSAEDRALVSKIISLGARTRWHLVRYVLYPLCLPSLFLGLYVSSTSAWMKIIFTEQTAARNRGLGYLTYNDSHGSVSALFAGLLLMALCSIFTWGVIWLLSRVVLHKKSQQ